MNGKDTYRNLQELVMLRLSQVWQGQDNPPTTEQIADAILRMMRAFPDLRVPSQMATDLQNEFVRLYQGF